MRSHLRGKGMRLLWVSAQNFRCFGADAPVKVRTSDVTALIGKNNTGKTTLLDALCILFGDRNPRYYHFEVTDYFDTAKPIIIEAAIHLVGTDTALQHIPKSHHKALFSSKSRQSGQILFSLRIPPLAVDSGDAGGTAPDSVESIGEAVDTRAFTIQYGGGKEQHKPAFTMRKKLVSVTYVPPARPAATHLNPQLASGLGRLLKVLLENAPNRDAITESLRTTNTLLRRAVQEAADNILTKARTTEYIDGLTFIMGDGNNPESLAKSMSVVISHDARSDYIDTIGTGTQSALAIGIMEALQRLTSKSELRLFLVEEPEAFLHPMAQRLVAKLLCEAARSGLQVLITTHSPAVVEKIDVGGVRRFSRSGTGGRSVLLSA